MDDPFFLIFRIICFLSTVSTFGVEFQCPPSFRNGENIVTCKINKTAIEEAHCFMKYSSVTFRRTIYSQTTVACQSPKYDPESECTPEVTHTPGTCWCSDSTGEIITYAFAFLANSSIDEGGQLECKLCVLPDNPLDVSVSESCKNISFANDIVPETETDTPALWIAVVIVIVILIIAAVVGILLIRKWEMICKTERKGDHDNKDVRNSTELEPLDKQKQGSAFEVTANENGKEKEGNGTLFPIPCDI